MSGQRAQGRQNSQLRSIEITCNYLKHAEGSALIQWGDTKVLCAATIEDRVPHFLMGMGKGWVTAEYSMLPRATHTRNFREAARGKIGGRTHEIQRLIARSLRAAVDLQALGERTITIDCDVIQADGGTRCASITGGYVALVEALKKLTQSKLYERLPLNEPVCAVSAGIINSESRLDLDYREDSKAEVDMNFIMTGSGNFVEIQGTAEQKAFSKQQMDAMTELALEGSKQLFDIQSKALAL